MSNIYTCLPVQIKYTAYSGWISSGLVSWTIDKVAIVDSFGKTLSVCKKGLILESGRPVYLPLYPGECNIPADNDNSTATFNSSSMPMIERMMTVEEKQQTGIGPFTKEQNYETKQQDGYSVEILSPNDRNSQQRVVGPFTRENNLRVAAESESATVFSDKPENAQRANPWIILDISNDGDSNSLENNESESGRSFSSGSSNLIYRASTSAARERAGAAETTTASSEIGRAHV